MISFSPSGKSASRLVRLLRATFLAIILIAIGASLGFCSEPGNGNGPAVGGSAWSSNYSGAVETAKSTHQPIMLVFTGSDWCIFCKKLKSEILDTPEFQNWSRNMAKVEIDFPQSFALSANIVDQNNRLKAKYADLVTTYPTVLFVDAQGNVLAKTGYINGGPKNWISQANQVLPKSNTNRGPVVIGEAVTIASK